MPQGFLPLADDFRQPAWSKQPEGENTMTATMQLEVPSGRLWTGRVLTGLASAFCILDGVMKLFKPVFVVEATKQLGYPEYTIVGIGVALLTATVLYLIPRTSVLGAIVLTGYLGGAIASNVRAETPMFNTAFPFIFAVIVWAGLWLRDPRLQTMVPLREKENN
jgi:hypothetical protein